MNIDFFPKIKTILTLPDRYTTTQIKNETMIFSGDMDFTMKMGGPITRRILTDLRESKEFMDAHYAAKQQSLNLVIDTRVNMVMAGWYPSIPGWHCDDVPRSEKYSQPDFALCNPAVQHFCCLISDTQPDIAGVGVSGTEYLMTPATIVVDPNAVWRSVDDMVNQMLHMKVLGEQPTGFAKDNSITQFNQNTLHRTSPARVPGWRLFFRASLTYRKPANEVRTQAQVYIPADQVGW